jgi:putative intracellular protease/amidase
MAVRTVHVGVYDGWADWEVGYLTSRINAPTWQRDPGTWQVRTVGATTAPVRTIGGLTIVPDLPLDQLDPTGSAMLVLPGSTQFDADDPGIAWAPDLAGRFVRAGVPVAAICGATLGLARTGLLDDRDHTSAAAPYLAASGYAGGARYREEAVVVDGGVITAGPTDPLPFARAALETLGVFEPTVLDAWYRLFRHSDPTAFGVLAAVR